jgi:hypothetical protein
VAELRFFNPYADIRFTANCVPHWQQEGAVYFVTFRLADAVAHSLRTRWESEREAWLRVHRNRGTPKSSANIMNDSQARSNVGSMLAMVLVSCDDVTAQKSWLKRCATSMAKE